MRTVLLRAALIAAVPFIVIAAIFDALVGASRDLRLDLAQEFGAFRNQWRLMAEEKSKARR